MKDVLPNPRQGVASKLPPLGKLASHPIQSAWTPGSIQDLLRKTALENRTNNFQQFYSIRSVGEHFHVPPATIRRIFRRLSSENLLRTVWGAGTLLEPSQNGKIRQAQMLLVPVALIHFITSSDYRSAVFKLQHHIWECGGAERLFFFQDNSAELLRICKRFGLARTSTVIWLFPDSRHRETILRLQDMGIRLVCIGSLRIPGIHHYHAISDVRDIGPVIRQQVLDAAS